MTDVHCHVSANDPTVREFLVGRDFVGVHPWETLTPSCDLARRLAEVEERLAASAALGVGEIGLDRLKTREVPAAMREAFVRQLTMAAALARPVVLHGAKCWGQVVKAVADIKASHPEWTCAFLCHGFSRSDGLLPEIVRLGGYVSVGPSILNDHAVNYRAMVGRIPRERILVETDRDTTAAEGSPTIRDVTACLARVLGVSLGELEALTDDNADRFMGRRHG